ncbi:MAG TPA: hypothetical protein VN688_27880 [Gemmataceae bacterium]|nr:hypothetical protein [Gemmataceae bacterium]
MPADKCSLANAAKALKRVLAEDAAGREKEWTERMGQALSALEQSVRRHHANLEDAEGRVVNVESSLNPSPTVARRADQLRDELDNLLQEAHALHGKLQGIHPSTARMDPSTAAGALAVAPEAGDVADFGVFCERVEHLLDGFEHYDEEESELIQESITMDLGAGD